MFEKGKIVESGNYDELVDQKGYFYRLERGAQFTWYPNDVVISILYVMKISIIIDWSDDWEEISK